MRREQIGVLLCFALILPALMIMPVQGSADDSFFTVTVVDLKFHVEVDLRIWLSIDDLSQFVDAEDSYSKEQGGFRSALLESIESGVQELVPDASVTELEINRIECDIPGKEMFVSLSFNIDNAIRKGDTIE